MLATLYTYPIPLYMGPITFVKNSCVTGNNTSGTKPCTDVQTVKAKSDNFCGKLLSNKSPFKECRNAEKVDFTKMYSSCEFDVCYSDRYDAHCQTLEGTALACSQHGYHVKWRNATFCRKYNHVILVIRSYL